MTTERSGRTITAAQIASDYSVVSGEGTYHVKAGNTTGPHDVLDRDENLVEGRDGKPLKKMIMNLKAFTGENAEKVRSIIAEKGETLEIEDLNGLTLSRNMILPDNGTSLEEAIPNQKVKVTVDYVEGREGQVLAVTGHRIPMAASAPAFSFGDSAADVDIPDANEKSGKK